MRIAFYAPLKSPDHPVPSGDRLMARLLIRCLEQAGHRVKLASDLRAFIGAPEDKSRLSELQQLAEAERTRIAVEWEQGGTPDLWFCYHPYYKAPDLIGPSLCLHHDVLYVTCEASYSPRRNIGIWAEMQAAALSAIGMARVNICLTERDLQGILAAAPQAHTTRLRPFIADPAPNAPQPIPNHLVCVAMMRDGDKMQSYRHLASALGLLTDMPWTLSIVGDGPMRAEIEALFADFSPNRVHWHGMLAPEAVAAVLSRGALYVWPGCGEAYGLAYLEAQAAGLPVVAFDTAGVPEVVSNGQTGLLVAAQDDAAFAAAISVLLNDPSRRLAMAKAAQQKVARDHSMATAAEVLDRIIEDARGAS